jgi:spore germination protein GerM
VTSRAARGAAPLALAALLLASCVGPGGSGVRTIDAEEVPYDLLDPAPPAESALTSEPSEPSDVPDGQVAAQVYLLGPDGLLLPSPTSVDDGTTGEVAARVLARLEEGPNEAERDAGLASALGPDLGLRIDGVDDGVVEVDVNGTTVPAADQVPLAIGQIVLTLTGVPGVSGVRIVNEGEPLPLPLPGGRLTTGTVTADDYLRLTVP